MTDDTTPCIGADIWRRACEQHPRLDRAQDRHGRDEFLRREIARITPAGLRAHVADIIREKRAAEFERGRQPAVIRRLEIIEAWMAEAERQLAIKIDASALRRPMHEVESVKDMQP